MLGNKVKLGKHESLEKHESQKKEMFENVKLKKVIKNKGKQNYVLITNSPADQQLYIKLQTLDK